MVVVPLEIGDIILNLDVTSSSSAVICRGELPINSSLALVESKFTAVF